MASLNAFYILVLSHMAFCLIYSRYAQLDLELREVRLPEEEHRMFFYYMLLIAIADGVLVTLLSCLNVIVYPILTAVLVVTLRSIGCLRSLRDSPNARLRTKFGFIAFVCYSVAAPAVLYAAAFWGFVKVLEAGNK